MSYVVEVVDEDRCWEEEFMWKTEAFLYAERMIDDGYSVSIKFNGKIRVSIAYGNAAEGIINYG